MNPSSAFQPDLTSRDKNVPSENTNVDGQKQAECFAKLRRWNREDDQAKRDEMAKDLLDIGPRGQVWMMDGFRCEYVSNAVPRGRLIPTTS
jgi:hypothetical protein